MKKYLGVLLFLFIDSRIGYCVTNCKQKDSWLCFSAQKWHLECPCTFTDDINSKDYKNGGFVIDINGGESMSIDCYDVKKIYMNMLPNITVDRIENFRLRFCPLPDRFKQVLDWLSIKDVKKLQFENSRVKNITLKKDYFESLDRLESLNLIGLNGLEVLDDTFVNTPKLLILDFQRISNLHLTPKLFKNIPLLKWLTIVESELEGIPDGFFENLENLQKLHLWSNNLTTLKESVFSNLARLKSLELSSNKIENIENGAFDNLTQLLTVSLAKNNLSSVPATLFAQNKKLEKIRMGHNVDLVLSDYFFSNLWSLKEVDLTNCQLKSLPEHVFENSTNLETLNLQRNKLTNLSEITFRLEKLKVLILRKNLISYLDGNTFKYLSSLENVDLEGNFITFIHHRTFCNKNLLKVINLSHNQYRGLDKLNLLECVPNLEEINFSYNFLARVTDVISGPLEKLRRLDLRHNFITEVFLSDLRSTGHVIVSLDHNNITTINFDSVITAGHVTLSVANNPIKCDCKNYKFIQYLTYQRYRENSFGYDIQTQYSTCADPPELRETILDTLSPSVLTCPLEKLTREYTGCPKECSCRWRPFDTSLVVNCTNRNLTELPQIGLSQMKWIGFNQTEVHLQNNSLMVGPNISLSGYDNVTKMFLSHNKIKTITWLPSQINELYLDNNRISHLGYDVLKMLNTSNLMNLTLGNNPWACECQDQNLTSFLRLRSKQVDARNIYCFNSRRLLIELNKNDLCQQQQILYVLLVVAVVVLLVVSAAFALYYRYATELKLFLFTHNLCLWWVTEEELDKDKTYDAFISYSHKDEDFVVETLLPVLESGPRPYKLCLHQRNWIPGEFITTHITNSVLESRRTLVILSPNFLESVWGKMEFRTAHTHAMTEGRTRVIVVLYGDVDVNSIDDEFKSYLDTNTYLKWGDPNFWDKLRYALPHSKLAAPNSQKIVNVMNCIDGKFNFVGPDSVSFDPDLLKNHTVNFVASAELTTPPAESVTLVTSTHL